MINIKNNNNMILKKMQKDILSLIIHKNIIICLIQNEKVDKHQINLKKLNLLNKEANRNLHSMQNEI